MNHEPISNCPFCGHPGQTYSTECEGLHCVECWHCNTRGKICDTIGEAIAAWNLREGRNELEGQMQRIDIENHALRREVKKLEDRCNPSKVVIIGNAGYYVSEGVYAYIELLKQHTAGLSPEAEIELKDGEHYAGIIVGKDGDASYHLILLPGEAESIKWSDAKGWAASIGGELPNRREQALLYANLTEQFASDWHWSSEQHASDSAYAWRQDFAEGSQDYSGTDDEFRARAVRRVLIFR